MSTLGILDQQEVQPKTYNIALAGNPNSGKTTIFNMLTGMRQKVANYPGVTVERKTGRFPDNAGNAFRIIDLPGLYSIIPRSIDEKIAADILNGSSPHEPELDLVIVTADASNLARGLYLCSQICDLNIPTVLVLNMMDIAKKAGVEINTHRLSEELGIPVLTTIAKEKVGIEAIKTMIKDVANRNGNFRPKQLIQLEKNEQEWIKPLQKRITDSEKIDDENALLQALRIISNSENGHIDGSDNQLVADIRAKFEAAQIPWQQTEVRARYAAIDSILKQATIQQTDIQASFTEKADRFLTHRIFGPIFMILVLSTIFQGMYTWSEAPMAFIEDSLSAFGEMVRSSMPAGALRGLMVDGIIAGVGAVLVFLPQIMFLFFFIAILEDTGYMARVAFIMDRFMAKMGLSGQSVIPLLSSFACAIPGIMAARTVYSTKDRLITILIAPFMSCSARLPVYALMIGAFFPSIWFGYIFYLPSLILLAMYLLGIVAAVISASILKNFVIKGESSHFIMELPPYQLPLWRFIFFRVYEAGKAFVENAGKIILAITIILWFLASYPKTDPSEVTPGVHETTQSAQLKETFAGIMGQAIEPVIEPLGFDWKIGVGLVTSFAAREVMVSTLATLYNIQDGDETSPSLREAIKKDINPKTGNPVFTPLVALSLMVFFVLACQCMSTLAIVRKETNSWRWPVVMFFYMLVFAYVASFAVFQTGSLLGFA